MNMFIESLKGASAERLEFVIANEETQIAQSKKDLKRLKTMLAESKARTQNEVLKLDDTLSMVKAECKRLRGRNSKRKMENKQLTIRLLHTIDCRGE